MTSNVARKAIVGFRPERTVEDEEALWAEVRQVFRPELLNRLDDVVVFAPLEPEHTRRIASLMLGDLEKRPNAQDIGLIVTETALEWLCKRGYDANYGARPLRRLIEQQIENPVAGKILRQEVRPGHVVFVDVAAGVWYSNRTEGRFSDGGAMAGRR
jgi:ATP-dependent Clp protease ATP-binding subunit ClpA